MSLVEPRILAINGGSSSIKFACFAMSSVPHRVYGGNIEGISRPDAVMQVTGEDPQDAMTVRVAPASRAAAVTALVTWITAHRSVGVLTAIGHRVVHGGPRYANPELVTSDMLDELRRIIPFDPQHLTEELALIEAFQQRLPGLPQVACFDTAFHLHMPRSAQIVPIPRRYETLGIRRYGFHGLSYAFIRDELKRRAGALAAQGKVIIAHLGNGASLVAMHHGASVDTSMGFTPASGIPMGSRSGDLDPGLFRYLTVAHGLTAQQFNHMVNYESGLLGISETSSDMRDLLTREPTDVRAGEAVALFCYHVKQRIGAFAATLGGIDTLVFTGGIGEHAAVIRTRICDGLQFLGIDIDPLRNTANDNVISSDASQVSVRVIPTDEERMIATLVSQTLHLEGQTGTASIPRTQKA